MMKNITSSTELRNIYVVQYMLSAKRVEDVLSASEYSIAKQEIRVYDQSRPLFRSLTLNFRTRLLDRANDGDLLRCLNGEGGRADLISVTGEQNYADSLARIKVLRRAL